MKICVVGSGYVGLVTGTCLAEAGNTVHCVDEEPDKVDALVRGEVPIYEPGLGAVIQQNVAAGLLRFSTDIAAAVGESEVVFLTVGTPGRRDGGADLRAVDAVAASVAEHVVHPTVLVLKSTVPVGTNERVQRIVASASHLVHVVSNPEFLKEGAAIKDFLHPERIVCGDAGTDERVHQLMERR